MQQPVSNPATPTGGVVNPPAISFGEIWPWAILFTALLLVQLYLVGMDEGAASLVPGQSVHEWVHDGRHLLGFPCH
jgi:Probable cobalt transporter subunit (CbtB)